MPHVGGPHVLDALGALAGAVGISAAVYFAMVSRRTVPVSWVSAFFLTGASLLLMHGGALSLPVNEALLLRLLGVTLAFVAEVSAAIYVLHTTEVPSATDAAEATAEYARKRLP